MRLEEVIQALRKRGYKVSEEYDTAGLSKVSGEPALGKTWWEKLQLLLQIITAIALPIAIFFGAQYFSDKQTTASQAAAQDQQREAALQSYLDRMSDLLLGNNTGKNSPSLASAHSNDVISQVASSRTLTVLRDLDGKRKGVVLQFLYDAKLIGGFTDPIVDLAGADLSNADLTAADLSNADLTAADLSNADLEIAFLNGTTLSGADLTAADLKGAQLKGAHLQFADLKGAQLKGAHLQFADLTRTDLSNADLSSTDITQQQVDEAITCKDTQTPTGITHSQASCP